MFSPFFIKNCSLRSFKIKSILKQNLYTIFNKGKVLCKVSKDILLNSKSL